MRALPCALVGALVIAGCGGGDKKEAAPTGTADPQAKQTAQAYLDAYSAKDAQAICGLLTPKVRKQLADNKGTCVKTMRFSIRKGTFPRLRIREALATGDTAVASVAGSQRQIELQRVGTAWKVSNGGL